MKKKILVTGADGFIGSHLVEALVKRDYDVKAFCLYNSFGHKGWLDSIDDHVKKNITFVLGDIRDQHSVESAMKGVDIVFNLAALIAIPYSYQAPSSYVDTNIKGTLNIVQAANNIGVEQVIHTSTSEVYGTAQYVPIDEKHPLVGQSPYSASKIGADHLALSFQKSFGTPVSIVRPFNTYGPRQSMRAVLPTIMMQLLAGHNIIKLGNLNATRDFSFIHDTVSGMIAFIGNQASIGQVINLGSGYEISIKEVASLMGKILGVDVLFDVEKKRIRPQDSEVERLCADNTLAKNILSWTPHYAGHNGLKNGLAETIAWFKENKNTHFYQGDVSSYAV